MKHLCIEKNVVSDRTLSFSDWWFDQMSCPGKKNIVMCCWVPGTQCESRKPSTEPRLTGWWFGTCFIFPSYWESHHPNWRTRSFFRGVGLNHQPVGFGMDFHATSWDNVPVIRIRMDQSLRPQRKNVEVFYCFALYQSLIMGVINH